MQLTGTVPAFLGNMKQLAELKIRANLFTGTLPNNLGLLPNLYYLDLAQNNLSGSIPPSFRCALSTPALFMLEIAQHTVATISFFSFLVPLRRDTALSIQILL